MEPVAKRPRTDRPRSGFTSLPLALQSKISESLGRQFVCCLALNVHSEPNGGPETLRSAAPNLQWKGCAIPPTGGRTSAVAADCSESDSCPAPQAAFFASPASFAATLTALLDALATEKRIRGNKLYFRFEASATPRIRLTYKRTLRPPTRKLAITLLPGALLPDVTFADNGPEGQWQQRHPYDEHTQWQQWHRYNDATHYFSAQWEYFIADQLARSCLQGELRIGYSRDADAKDSHSLKFTLCARRRWREATNGVLLASSLQQMGEGLVASHSAKGLRRVREPGQAGPGPRTAPGHATG